MTRRRRSPNGEPQRFVLAASGLQQDACEPWPYALYPNGYGALTYAGRTTTAHNVVCEIVHGPCPSGHEAAHSCGARACVNPRHLRWATPLENADDKRAHGMIASGERQGQAKLTQDQVFALRATRVEGSSIRQLSRRFGVSPSQVCRIVNGQSWAA